MKSRITDRFRRSFANLPEQVQEKTRSAYRQYLAIRRLGRGNETQPLIIHLQIHHNSY